MAKDKFSGAAVGMSGPLTSAFDAATDGADLANVTRALWVGTGGHLVVTFADGTTRTFKNVPSGTLLPFRAASLGVASTAADVVGLI